MYVGMAPLAVVGLTDALFTPLAERQVTYAQRANVQTATNDTLTSLAVAYFDTVEARARLAGIEDVVRRVQEAVQQDGIFGPGTGSRPRGGACAGGPGVGGRSPRGGPSQLAEWRVPKWYGWRGLGRPCWSPRWSRPQLQVTLISPERTPEELIPLAVQNRPELAFDEAQIEAARQRLSQERRRPYLPIAGGAAAARKPLTRWLSAPTAAVRAKRSPTSTSAATSTWRPSGNCATWAWATALIRDAGRF